MTTLHHPRSLAVALAVSVMASMLLEAAAWSLPSSSSLSLVARTRLTTTRLAASTLADDSDGSTGSNNKNNNDDPMRTSNDPPRPPRRTGTVMSEALPFLACPEPLIDCPLAGNVGFDPLRLAKNTVQLYEYREAEIKHARLAMLAAAGWPLSELYDERLANTLGWPTLLDDGDRVPSLLNGRLDQVSPVWWGFCLGLTAAIDLYGIAKSRAGDPTYFPGKLDFDPLGLYPADTKGRQRMELAEIKHGRLAMIAVVAFGVQEYVTKQGVVDETPFFFFPWGSF